MLKTFLIPAVLLIRAVSCAAVPEEKSAIPSAALAIVSRLETVFTAPPGPHPKEHGMSFAVAAPLLGNGDLGVCITGNPDAQTFWVTKNDFWWLKNGVAAPLNFGALRITAPALAGAGYPTQSWGAQKQPVFILAEQGPVIWQNNTVHIQHIYPAGQIGLDSAPELLATASNTIAQIQRWHDGNGSNSFFPAAIRVGYDPQAILRELRKYSNSGMAPNGFSRGNPHGIENCSTVPNAVNEMLIQSHEGVLRLFPVWPKKMDARFGTLRARGAFLVSAELKNGEVCGVCILSEKGRDLTVVNPWPGKKVCVVRKPLGAPSPSSGLSAESATGTRFTLKTTVNETLELKPE